MKISLPVLLPINVRQGDGSVVVLLSAMAQTLKDAAREKADARPEHTASVQEKLMAATAIRDCIDRIRRESSELWRQVGEERKARETRTPGDTCPRPESQDTTGATPPADSGSP